MTAQRSNAANAWQTNLTSQMAATDLTATVASTTNGPASPGYFVIEPDKPSTQMEFAFFDGVFTATTLVASGIGKRYLGGSAAGSGLIHPTGSIVRSVPTAELITDIFDYIETKANTASPTFTGTVTLPGDPGTDLVAADKRYVDINTVTKRVRVVAATNGTISTAYANGQTVDGVTLATGDRILLAGQTSGSANGIYVVAASGSPARAADFDVTAKALSGMLVTVSEGTVYADTVWQLTTNAAITLDTTALVFSRVPGMLAVSKTGSAVGTRPKLNLIEGTNVTMTVSDNSGSDRVDVTINASASAAAFSGCRVRNTSGTNVSTATYTALPFATEIHDVGNYHDNVTNNTRLTAVSTGYHRVTWGGTYIELATAGVQRKINLFLNGAVHLEGFGQKGAVNDYVGIPGPSCDIYLTAGDYLELKMYQDSGSTVVVQGNGNVDGQPYFAIQYLGT